MPVYLTKMTMHPGRLNRRAQDEGTTFVVAFAARNPKHAHRLVADYLCNRYVMAMGGIKTIRPPRPVK